MVHYTDIKSFVLVERQEKEISLKFEPSYSM